MARALVWKLLIVFCGLFIAETLASRHRRHHRSPSKTPVKIYGHVHMPKTAGANLNAVIAARFERVCGHKGYSFDAHQANMRYAETARAYNSSSGDNKAGKQELDTGPLVVDSYTALYRLHNRHRVPRTIMDEIGYENCDWISHEAEADVWSRFQKWPLPMELHVPCRDPVDHMLSQCNHIFHVFDCDGDMASEIKKCLLGMD